VRGFLIRLAGAFMVLSAVAHAVAGWPPMRLRLERLGADADLVAGLAAGWYFGSVAMAAFGVIVLLAGWRLRRGDESGLAAVRVIAASYVLFGGIALLALGLNPFFLLFVATGLVAAVPAWPARQPSPP
jgi:hypothetical protein